MRRPLRFSGLPAVVILVCLLSGAAPARAGYAVFYNDIWSDGNSVYGYVATALEGFCSTCYWGDEWLMYDTTNVQADLWRDSTAVDSDGVSNYGCPAEVFLYDEVPPGGTYNYASTGWHSADWYYEQWGEYWSAWASGSTYQNTSVTRPPPPIVQYPPGYLDEMPGELLEYGSVDAYGGVSNALLDPDAFNYLVSSGFLQAAETLTQLVVIPEIGPVIEAIFVITVLAHEAVEWLHRRGLGSDPAAVKQLPREVAGTRDETGNCVQVLPPNLNFKWRARNKSMGVLGPIHWHWTVWNQNPATCRWFFNTRGEGPNDPGPGYVLLPGVFGE